ncbi:MAG: RNase adapter RapZ, partial [Pseudomonadota bacterium]
MRDTDEATEIVLITGPSGAGRITAIRSLEDLGFEVIDNLPIALLRQLLALPSNGRRPIAVGLDVRTRDFTVRGVEEMHDWMRGTGWLAPKLLFLDCSPEVLQRRFSETRRPHPLGEDEGVEGGIRREIEILAPLRERADHVVDTTDFSPHDLKAQLKTLFAGQDDLGLAVSVES